MEHFFELKDSKKKSLSVQDLQKYAERLEIKVHKISEKSGKEIKKTKQELIDELNSIKTNKGKKTGTQISTHSKSKSKNELQKEVHNKGKSIIRQKLIKDNIPKVLVWMPSVKDEFLNEDKKLLNNMLNKEYIEKKLKIKVKLGSILYYGEFYIWNNEKFVYMNSFLKNNVHHLIIPREMSQKIDNSISFFEKIENYENNEFFIQKIELGLNDDYLKDLFFDVAELNGIYFNYEYINDKYEFIVEINYLNSKGEFNDKFPKYTFISNKEINFLRLVDLQNKLSKHQFEFNYSINGLFQSAFKPTWLSNILIKNENIVLGNFEEKKEFRYECDICCTMYNKYENEENLRLEYIDKLNFDELLINFDDLLQFKDKNEFKQFIDNNDITNFSY